MITLDPYGSDTVNTSAAFYECWECDLCPPPPWLEPTF